MSKCLISFSFGSCLRLPWLRYCPSRGPIYRPTEHRPRHSVWTKPGNLTTPSYAARTTVVFRCDVEATRLISYHWCCATSHNAWMHAIQTGNDWMQRGWLRNAHTTQSRICLHFQSKCGSKCNAFIAATMSAGKFTGITATPPAVHTSLIRLPTPAQNNISFFKL